METLQLVMNRTNINIRTISRITERGLKLYASFNEQCPSELSVLADYYAKCQDTGILSRAELTHEEKSAYKRVTEVLALEGAKPLVSELLFLLAQYGHGTFGLAMSLITLPTAPYHCGRRKRKCEAGGKASALSYR